MPLEESDAELDEATSVADDEEAAAEVAMVVGTCTGMVLPEAPAPVPLLEAGLEEDRITCAVDAAADAVPDEEGEEEEGEGEGKNFFRMGK